MLQFWRENIICGFCGKHNLRLWWKCDFGGKHDFTVLAAKREFIVLAWKLDFANLTENMILRVRRKIYIAILLEIHDLWFLVGKYDHVVVRKAPLLFWRENISLRMYEKKWLYNIILRFWQDKIRLIKRSKIMLKQLWEFLLGLVY